MSVRLVSSTKSWDSLGTVQVQIKEHEIRGKLALETAEYPEAVPKVLQVVV